MVSSTSEMARRRGGEDQLVEKEIWTETDGGAWEWGDGDVGGMGNDRPQPRATVPPGAVEADESQQNEKSKIKWKK